MQTDSIQAAKQGFEQSFAEGTFYNRQTQDSAHLGRILAFLPVTDGMRILDLGTGTGYLAFPLAERFPTAAVTGLDIVEKALDANRLRAEQAGIRNLRFLSYDGRWLPFADGAFDLVVSRYSLHHFPDPAGSFAEISRVLRAGGYFFLSDPAPHPEDADRFADRFMRLKPDGHISFYTAETLSQFAAECGLIPEDAFDSKIRFPRKYSQEYADLLQAESPVVSACYEIAVIGDEVFITEPVNNILFCKRDVTERSIT